MNLEVDVERLSLAHKAVRAELLSERAADGHWAGHLGSSPFATAAAVSALVVAHHRDSQHALKESDAGDGQAIEQVVQCDLSELLLQSVHWLARQQNPDGGWSDCEGARSNIAATMMVQAAFRLTGIPAKYADLMARADDYVEAEGGVAALTPPLQWRQNAARRNHGQLCAGRHGDVATSAHVATRIGLPADPLAAKHSGVRPAICSAGRSRRWPRQVSSRSTQESNLAIVASKHLAKKPDAAWNSFKRPTTASWHRCRSQLSS